VKDLETDLEEAYRLLVAHMRQAEDMWAFSEANPTRGNFDIEWNRQREEILRHLREPTYAPQNAHKHKRKKSA
jgi:hypothetical protein